MSSILETLEAPDKQKLSLEVRFDTRSIDANDDADHWLQYTISIAKGSSKLTARDAAMTSDELEQLNRFLGQGKTGVFAPLESDFELRLEILEDGQHLLTCFIEDGVEKVGHYTGTGIGIRMLTNNMDLKKFAEQLMQATP